MGLPIEARVDRMNRQRHLRSVTAAAQYIPNIPEAKGSAPRKWQKRVWNHYNSVGEIWFAQNYTANVLSRVRLFPARQDDPMQPPIPVDSPQAMQELDRLRGVDGTHGEIIHDCAMQLSIPGEGYIVGHATEDNPDAWDIYSTAELAKRDGQWFPVDERGQTAGEPLHGNGADPVVVHRVWQRHPQFRSQPDSAMRAIADLLDELILLDRMYRSNARSRIPSGFLLVPDELSTVTQMARGQQTGQGQTKVKDPFMASVLEALMSPVGDEESAANISPPVIKMKKDLIEKIRHLSFARDFDAETSNRYNKVIDRAIAGIDLPSEIVKGLADVNHWTGALLNQDAFNSHLAPKMQLVCSSFTQGFFRPALGDPDIFIWYDASAIMARPSPDVTLKAHAQILISDEAGRKYVGFGDDDAPTPEEAATRAERSRPAQGTPTSETAPPEEGSPVTASAAPRSGLVLGRWLATQERELRFKIQQEADKVVSKAVKKAALTAALPDDNEIVDDAVTTIVPIFIRNVSRAQRRTRTELRAQGYEQERLDELEVRQEEDRDRGSDVMAKSLGSLVSALVLGTAIKFAVGEDSVFSVASGLVRDALAVAGGAPTATKDHAVTEQPAGGVFTGDAFMDAMAELEKTPDSWQWLWNDSERPFDSHLDLDGKNFLDWTDDVLAVQPGDEWLGVSHYAPGDHAGCNCDFIPVFADANQEAEGAPA